MTQSGPLKLLFRSDKYYLGGGNRLLFAPPFPHFLNFPGFWDAAQYFNFEFQPLFTWALLDDEGKEIPLEFNQRRWTPACLTQQFTGRSKNIALIAEEEKTILSNDVALCRVRIAKWRGRRIRLHFVAWTSQGNFPSAGNWGVRFNRHEHGQIAFEKTLRLPGAPELTCCAAFGLDAERSSFCVQLSEGKDPLPRWQESPMCEKFRNGRLPGTTSIAGVNGEGVLTLALHTALDLKPGEEGAITAAMAVGPTIVEAKTNLRGVLRIEDPVDISRHTWEDYFAGVPWFSCSDEFLTRYYWYRWYGLRLNTIDVIEGNYEAPFVCEGIGYFRAPITYSSFCHMLENRWRHAGDLARGSLRTFLAHQRPDGGFRGYLDLHHYRQEMFYHANWGEALLELERIHPSREFIQEAYQGLADYARYFDRERDEEISGLYDIDNHYETGQEFMSRYAAVDPNADRENWGEVFRLKGVDVTVYLYQLKRALAAVARALGKPSVAELWDIEAEKIKSAVLIKMWDPSDEMFYDVNPATGEPTRVKAAVCFYPFMTDIVGPEHLAALRRHLLNRSEFWTPFPVPSTSADDPTFCPEPEWKGKRMNCPWNGRVWPMTNSHVAEALARSAIRFGDPVLRRKAAEFIRKFIHMMFFDGDPRRPNCFEHYNPLTGYPSVYRGIDDYQHSWVNDLILKYVCGIRPGDSTLTVDPLPFGLRRIDAGNVVVKGARISVEVRDRSFSVRLDGALAAKSTIGKPVILDLP